MSKTEKERDELREHQEKIAEAWRTHPNPEFDGEVEGLTGEGNEKAKPIELSTAGGRLHINTHGEAVLDQDGVIDLRRKLDQAFQAVS